MSILNRNKSRKKSKKVQKKKVKAKPGLTASTADKYDLYQRSVQSPEEDIKFLARIYKKERDRPATHFREDFSGTALLTSHWIRRGDGYTAEAFDIDPEPLAWGKEHNFELLGEAARRAVLHQADVREPSLKKPDVRCAQNFSYWVFTSRQEMLGYFKSVYDDLDKEGIFIVDVHGGPECQEEMEEETQQDGGFTYVWDQHEFWPVTHEAKLFIHFRFKDGTEMNRAFTYEWRLWTLPELRDILLEAGFPRVDCYWEGTADDGVSGNGVFRKTKRGEADLSWVAYLVAPK